MKAKIFSVLLALGIVFGFAVATAPAASASSVDNVYMYEHQGYGGSIVWNGKLTNQRDCNTTGYFYNVPWPSNAQGSSIKAYVPAMRHCNVLGVKAGEYGAWYWECINYADPGIVWFGPGYNDNVVHVGIAYNASCGLW